jgi:predicted glycosyltransferase
MDYEYQPANHLSFRLANHVVVPRAFPRDMLRRCGARPHKVIRYAGFKEELYLAGFKPDRSIVNQLGLDVSSVIAVMRPPPEGALYHPASNRRFDEIVEAAVRNPGVQLVLLPRDRSQEQRYRGVDGIVIPNQPIDGLSLLACADVAIGAGGTMNRESALLGTPTYTVFSGRLAAVDAALIRAGLLRDLRAADSELVFERKSRARRMVLQARRDEILSAVTAAITKAAR